MEKEKEKTYCRNDLQGLLNYKFEIKNGDDE